MCYILTANESMAHNGGAPNGTSLLGTPISASRLAGSLRSTPLSGIRSRPLTSTIRTPVPAAANDHEANNVSSAESVGVEYLISKLHISLKCCIFDTI